MYPAAETAHTAHLCCKAHRKSQVYLAQLLGTLHALGPVTPRRVVQLHSVLTPTERAMAQLGALDECPCVRRATEATGGSPKETR